MCRKHLLTLMSVIGILVLVMSIAGCQGYQAPQYKSPDDTTGEGDIDITNMDEGWEEVDTADDEWDVDFDELEDTADDTATEENTPVESYTPATKTDSAYRQVTTDNTEEETDFKKSPYRPLVEEDVPTMTVTEGDLVAIKVRATDADGDPLTYRFTAPLNSEGKWQTRSGDTGVYYSDITVTDGKADVERRIKIIVEPKNNKPVLQFIPNIAVNEGATVTIEPRATDADGDRLEYSYSGWMTQSTKKTGYQDAGVHKVVVSVTDGISTVSQELTVTVNDMNRPPQVEIEF